MLDRAETTRKPATGDLLDGSAPVFVAPRVIDENAYARYAEDLRSMLDRVADEAASLNESTTDAKSFFEEIRSTKNQRRAEIESITKLLKATDARAKQIDETLRDASERLESLNDIDTRAEEVAQRKAGEAEKRIEAMFEEFERRLVDRAAEHEQRFLWAAHETEEIILERLAELRAENERATELLGRPAGHPANAPVAHGSLLDVLRRAEEGAERVGDLRRRLAETDYKARESVDALENTLEKSVERAGELTRTNEELCESTETALRASRSVEGALNSRADELADLSASLGTLVDEAGDATGSLREIMRECEELRIESSQRHDELVDRAESIDTALEQLEPWRHLLERTDATGGPDSLPPVLARIVQDFRSGMALDLARLADAVNSVVDRHASPLGGSSADSSP